MKLDIKPIHNKKILLILFAYVLYCYKMAFILSDFVEPSAIVGDNGKTLIVTASKRIYDRYIESFGLLRSDTPCIAQKTAVYTGQRPEQWNLLPCPLTNHGRFKTHYFIEVTPAIGSLQRFNLQFTQYEAKCILFELLYLGHIGYRFRLSPGDIMLRKLTFDRSYMIGDIEYRTCSDMSPLVIPIDGDNNPRDAVYSIASHVDISVEFTKELEDLIDSGYNMRSRFFDDLIFSNGTRSYYLQRPECSDF
jgi:hypothetical protein